MTSRPPVPLRLATFALLLALPMAWTAPLMRAGLLPLFGLAEISVLSGVQVLWQTDIFIALLVTFFALIAPLAKVVMLLLIQYNRASHRWMAALHHLSRLAMADVFLIALYIVIVKGVGLGRVEAAWGLYAFTSCVLATLILGALTTRAARGTPD
ncbi:MAG: putative paraquat-inducible protein A [Dinoroseobacter sp.]|jgi:paraquat-inducible protein A